MVGARGLEPLTPTVSTSPSWFLKSYMILSKHPSWLVCADWADLCWSSILSHRPAYTRDHSGPRALARGHSSDESALASVDGHSGDDIAVVGIVVPWHDVDAWTERSSAKRASQNHVADDLTSVRLA
jgi:hypothetical protein